MSRLFDGEPTNIELLTNRGSEFSVYKSKDKVYKIFKNNYRLGHIDEKSIDYLSMIKTNRILMPTSKLYKNNNLIGYEMPYIEDNQSILESNFNTILNELKIINDDIEMLTEYFVRLIDINKENSVFSGKLYLIDPANYFINDINDLLIYYNNEVIDEGKKKSIIKNWNYDKINKLLYEYLFINNPEIDFYILRKIIEFFSTKRKEQLIDFDYDIYKNFFNQFISAKEAINQFIKDNIVIDYEEKEKIMSLIRR